MIIPSKATPSHEICLSMYLRIHIFYFLLSSIKFRVNIDLSYGSITIRFFMFNIIK